MNKPVNITLVSKPGDLNFEGKNERGQTLSFSGNKEAVSPMESVLMAAAACSSIDVEIFLKKMRQSLETIEVEVKGERVDEIPAVYSTIHLHYKLSGDIKQDKAKKAVDMSVEKYCSVSKMLEKEVKITHSFEIL